jgi:hypothetical protein
MTLFCAVTKENSVIKRTVWFLKFVHWLLYVQLLWFSSALYRKSWYNYFKRHQCCSGMKMEVLYFSETLLRPTSPHGITTQKIIISTFIAMRTSLTLNTLNLLLSSLF